MSGRQSLFTELYWMLGRCNVSDFFFLFYRAVETWRRTVTRCRRGESRCVRRSVTPALWAGKWSGQLRGVTQASRGGRGEVWAGKSCMLGNVLVDERAVELTRGGKLHLGNVLIRHFFE